MSKETITKLLKFAKSMEKELEDENDVWYNPFSWGKGIPAKESNELDRVKTLIESAQAEAPKKAYTTLLGALEELKDVMRSLRAL